MLRVACAAALILTIAGCGGGSGTDDAASRETTETSDPAERDLVAYFLKFPTDEAAERAIPDLAALGFTLNPEYTAAFAEDGKEGWLVVERGDPMTEIERAEDVLNDVAEKYGGMYDGWEVAVGP